MKKFVVFVAALVVAVSASAQHRHDSRHDSRHQHHQHRSSDWVGPAIVGVIIGGAIASQSRSERAPAPVIVEPQVVVVPSYPRYIMKSVDVYIEECNCTRTVRVPVPLPQ